MQLFSDEVCYSPHCKSLCIKAYEPVSFSNFCAQTCTHSLSCSQPQSIAVDGNPFLAQNIRIYHECEGRIEKSVSRLAE